MIDSFLLISGEDIPLTSENIIIHNPTLKELIKVFLCENDFFTGFEFLFFSKESLGENEQKMLSVLSDFEILLTLLANAEKSPMKEQLDNLKKFLLLLFKNYQVEFQEEQIVLTHDKYVYFIQEDNFNELKNIVNKMFPFKGKQETELNFQPQGRKAKEIAEKIKKGREKIAKQKQQKGETESLFERYLSILNIGLQMPISAFLNYTVYQLLDVFDRYEKKEVYDVYLQAQLAGATGMKEVDHWMM